MKIKKSMIVNEVDVNVDLTLQSHSLTTDPKKESWYSLEIEAFATENTVTRTTLVLNTIQKEDLLNLAKICTELANKMKE